MEKTRKSFSVLRVCSDILQFVAKNGLEVLAMESGSVRWKGITNREVLVQKIIGESQAKYCIEAPDRRETISISKNLGAIMYQVVPKEYEGSKPKQTQTGKAIIAYLEPLYEGKVTEQ